MAEIIHFAPNTLGYAHVICGDCSCNSFYVEIDYAEDGSPTFNSIICTNCDNVICCDLRPVYRPKGGK